VALNGNSKNVDQRSVFASLPAKREKKKKKANREAKRKTSLDPEGVI